jgi:hypothetical protein
VYVVGETKMTWRWNERLCKNTRFLQNKLEEEDEVVVEPNNRKRRGPGTPQGKERVGRNAIKHGVFAKTPSSPSSRTRTSGFACGRT